MSTVYPQQRGTAELQVWILEMPSNLSLLNHDYYIGELQSKGLLQHYHLLTVGILGTESEEFIHSSEMVLLIGLCHRTVDKIP